MGETLVARKLSKNIVASYAQSRLHRRNVQTAWQQLSYLNHFLQQERIVPSGNSHIPVDHKRSISVSGRDVMHVAVMLKFYSFVIVGRLRVRFDSVKTVDNFSNAQLRRQHRQSFD